MSGAVHDINDTSDNTVDTKKSKGPKKTGQQLSVELDDIRTSVNYLMGILLALVPPDFTVGVGSTQQTRKQLQDNAKNISKAMKSISGQVKKGVRKTSAESERLARETAGDTVTTKKNQGGLVQPSFYAKELVDFVLKANLGLVDPKDPKSEKVTDVLKRSVFGNKRIATRHTLDKIFSLLVRNAGFSQGNSIKFPEGYLQKHLPNIHQVLVESGFDMENIKWIALGSIHHAGVIPKTDLTEAQKKELLDSTEQAYDLLNYSSQVKNHVVEPEKYPTVPVLPASLVATCKTSPKKK